MINSSYASLLFFKLLQWKHIDFVSNEIRTKDSRIIKLDSFVMIFRKSSKRSYDSKRLFTSASGICMSFLMANPIRSYFSLVIAIVTFILRLLAAFIPLMAMQRRLPFVLSAAAVASEGFVLMMVLMIVMMTAIMLAVYNQTSPYT